ncbi:nucleophile aminohydrolase [Coprinopsis sp. MPI-PUGE-AT-0042]|nr:nucleophile aminohydrolase [Coprinopsis sp. MPI-PUGE-AT-0042]
MFADGVQRTQQPIVTGTSVLALRYKDGIMMAADNLASYGSLARFKDIQRLQPVGANTVVGAGGDMSDFQYIQRVLDELVIDEFTAHDGHSLGPREIHEYLSQVMYARRTKINPLWNSLLVGGFKNGESFLAYVDLLGTTYSASTLATGYGAYLAQPLLRSEVEGKEETLTEEEALAIMEKCMRVLFYRDARSLDKYQIATVTEKGVNISESKYLTTSWSFAEGIRGYGAQTQ